MRSVCTWWSSMSRAAVGDLGRVRDRRVDGATRRVDEPSRDGDGVDVHSGARHVPAPFATRALRPSELLSSDHRAVGMSTV